MSHAIDASVVAAMLFNKNSPVGSLIINGLPGVITISKTDPNLPCGYMIALLEREDTCGLGGTMVRFFRCRDIYSISPGETGD